MAWHRLASLGMGLDACGRLVFYSVFVLGAALVSEWGVPVRKDNRSGVRKGLSDCDRGCAEAAAWRLGLAEGNVLGLFFHVVTPSGPRHDHGVHGRKRSGDAGAMAQELSHLQAIRLP